MSTPYWQGENVTLYHGDCIEVMAGMAENSIDAIVCDPPYGLEFMGKAWDSFDTYDTASNATAGMNRTGYTDGGNRLDRPSFYGGLNPRCRNCDKSQRGASPCVCTNPAFTNERLARSAAFGEWSHLWAVEALRVLKPGGHLLAFGGTRTWHRLAVAVEDAGFEIRDSIAWLYGSGFPKSLDVSKAIDKAAGAQREVIGTRSTAKGNGGGGHDFLTSNSRADQVDVTMPATEAAQQWAGWGTALKPAFEPIVVARKPLVGTVAGNVLAHGTGALNIDGCRIAATDERKPVTGLRNKSLMDRTSMPNDRPYMSTLDPEASGAVQPHDAGRWPANVVLDADQAATLNQQSGTRPGFASQRHLSPARPGMFGVGDGADTKATHAGYDDEGGASRFFYVAKAPTAERPTYYTQPCNCEGAYPCKAASQPRATDDSGSDPGRSWNTSTSGNKPTDGAYLPGMTSTTGIETNSTTTSTTSNSSPRLSTNESTQGASNAAGNGGNPAQSAVSSSSLAQPIGISAAKGGPSTGGADPAILPRWSQLSRCGVCGLPAKREAHATVKPIDLMQWLIRLVTPPGGTVLDPFAGSGTTGEATIREGFESILIEREADYLPLIRERFQRPINYLLEFGDPA
jgi:site-specific DNA-methyltransferase (adenine-specific)